MPSFRPDDILYFIELSEFVAAWRDLGLNDEEDLAALQISIMKGPNKNPVIPGTGGLRKMRFAPPKWNTGKRGAARVCYVYFPAYGIVVLAICYSKGDADDLSEAGKRTIKRQIAEIEKELDRLFHG